MLFVNPNMDEVGRASVTFMRVLFALTVAYIIECLLHIVSIARYEESPFSLATSCVMFMMLFLGWYGAKKRLTSYLSLYYIVVSILVFILCVSLIMFFLLIAAMSALLSQYNQGRGDVVWTSDGVTITKQRIALDTAAAIFSIIVVILQIISCVQAGRVRYLILRNYPVVFPNPNAVPVVMLNQGSYSPPVVVAAQAYQPYPYPQQPQGQYVQYPPTQPQPVYMYPNQGQPAYYPNNVNAQQVNNNNTNTNTNNQANPNPYPEPSSYNDPNTKQ
eukprot:TRINITY_DN1952_c0_g1_i1.p1 TRINITY_DN1952_c0_g1~~TRINITY_DN1952_c0_g1_i1.p1  ORF type:complete len:274 (+),score=44.06 TRINITY_DN1952_c0_g1_i1:206-1027(+)